MSRLRGYLVPLLAAVCLAVGATGWWMAYDQRSTPAAENDAVVDATATAQVRDAVTEALTGVLSYDFSNPQASRAVADEVLVGDAREEYDTLLASLQERAPDQQLVLRATVQAAAVKHLDEDSAELLVFIDQTSQRADDDEASVSAAQLAITATRDGGEWRISELQPL